VRDYVATANQYADAVVSGEILACRWVKLACARHLKDLKASSRKSYPYEFDVDSASYACRFTELLPHTKGQWAVGRSDGSIRIVLEPWQVFFLCALFGWVHKSTGLRRFRKAYLEVPRKNGKSILAAAIGLLMFAADDEYGAEVYSGATSEKQAWEVFRPAKMMAERTPGLRNRFGISVNAKTLNIPTTGSRFEPVIGNPGDGASPSCAIVDEFHEHRDDSLFDTMLTGMGSRQQPLMLVITTAGTDLAGPCYAMHGDLRQVLAGVIQDPELLGIIYTVDEGEDWTSEAALRKANPNYGVSVSPEYLASRQAEAIRSSRKQNTFKTKHLNLWGGARSSWMNLEAWEAAKDATLRLEDFVRESCWIKIDLSAAVKIFVRNLPTEVRNPETGEVEVQELDHYYAFGRYYVPEERVLEPEKKHYAGWVAEGSLIQTGGAVIDHNRIELDLVDDSEKYQLEEVGFDPYGATQLVSNLQDQHGIDTIEIPQGVKHLSDPMKWVEAMVLAGRFHHDGNPVLTWAVANVTARVDANENVYPRKERPENMIDPAVATIMAMARAMVGESRWTTESPVRVFTRRSS
jgi:phage terminase large subunit-like protein